jgi:2,4-dienoyl-CoA reductase-like NADH-dependent reductase (Old Yellow Enzyme family)
MVQDVDLLFEPLKVNSTIVKNRFVMPAMQRGGVRNYSPTVEMADILKRCGEGGSGIIICEGAAPDHPSSYWQPIFGTITHENKDGWGRIAQAVTRTGAIYLMQLWHPGAIRLLAEGIANPYPDHPALSPSGLVQEGRRNGLAMSRQDLKEIKDGYVASAVIAQQIGANGIEIHAAHGYLLDLFLWHETNLRDDEYGGATLVERARFPAEIVSAIRAATGPDFIISFRFSQWKEVDYGARIADHPDQLKPFIALIENAGADLFHVSTRRFDKPEWPELHAERSLASWVKSMTTKPVIAIGSVGLTTDLAADIFDDEDPELQIDQDLGRVSKAMRSGDFDMIGVGRAHIANNDLVQLVRNRQTSRMKTFRKYVDLKAGYENGYVHEGQIVDQSRKRS